MAPVWTGGWDRFVALPRVVPYAMQTREGCTLQCETLHSANAEMSAATAELGDRAAHADTTIARMRRPPAPPRSL